MFSRLRQRLQTSASLQGHDGWDLLILAGVALAGVGVSKIYGPAGWIFFGAVCAFIGWLEGRN